MKVVAINGSPRKDGNTALALAAIADELAQFDIEMEIIQIGHKAIHGCMSCGICAKRRDLTCGVDDCVNEVLPKMAEADAIILGSLQVLPSSKEVISAILHAAWSWQLLPRYWLYAKSISPFLPLIKAPSLFLGLFSFGGS